jgi:transcriptional regulator with XRE-family HTH domain
MRVHPETFEAKRKAKRPPMSLAAVAKKAGVSERRINEIKNNPDMRESTVEKIAKALDTSVSELCSPPQEKFASNRAGIVGNNIELAAFRYGVAPELIEELAPILFVAIAELALKRRSDRLEEWWSSVEASRRTQPKFGFDTWGESCADRGFNELVEAYWEEKNAIESYSLEGWANDREDHFIEALFSIDQYQHNCFTFEGWLPQEYYKDNKPSYPRASLKGLEGSLIFHDAFFDAINELSAREVEIYNPVGDGLAPVHPVAQIAEHKLMADCITLSQMPLELRSKGNEFERAVWIASAGGTEELPEICYNWEPIRRVIGTRFYEEEVARLTVELKKADDAGRAEIEGDLEEASRFLAAWKALAMPGDEEWYRKWELFNAQDENETLDEEGA